MTGPDVVDHPTVDDHAPEAEVPEPSFSPWRLVVLVAAIAALGWWQGWKLLAVIAAIAAMIFLHELGHFVMARRAGMKVTEFFIGIGPRIWSFRRGEVEYGLKAIPAVAYVRIIGMTSADEVAPEDEPRTYREQGFWDRIGVAVAGSSMHFLLAILLAFAAFAFYGIKDDTTWVVDETTPGSAAALAGLHDGDRVVSVAGTRVSTFDEMSAVVRRHPAEDVRIVLLRHGRTVSLDASLGAKALLTGTVGEDLSFGEYRGQVRINSVGTGKAGEPRTRARAAGLADGDLITSVNGVTLHSLRDLAAAAEAGRDGRVTVDYVRRGKPATAHIDLGHDLGSTRPVGFLGVGQGSVAEHVGVLDAAGHTFRSFGQVMVASVKGIGTVFSPSNLANFASRTFDPSSAKQDATATPAAKSHAATSRTSELNRPVSIIGIVGLGNQLSDLRSFLGFMAAINITIGALNLIPLLPFDGGHVAIAVYERIRELFRRDGRRYLVDAAKLLPALYAVVIVVVFIGLLSGYADIVRPIQL
jgi:RIP metalloprotease RseP